MAGEGGSQARAVSPEAAPQRAAVEASPALAPARAEATDLPPILRRLVESPASFDFFQAVRLLECAFADRPRVGADNRAARDVVRFGQVPSLAFAPATVAGFEPGPDGRPPKLSVNFLGLLGPNGPMPLHFTAYVWERLRSQRDPVLTRFLDLFHHRMIALFYRAWAQHQQTVGHDRPGGDRFSVYVGSLIGIGVESLMRRDAVGDVAKLHFSGRLLCQTKHAEGLRAILSDYFSVPVEIRQFVGQWVELPEDSRCLLGQSPDTGTLGSTAIVGRRMWDVQQKFRIRLGPVGMDDYQKMLPGGESLKRLVAWVRSYVGDEFAWDLQLVLKRDEVPAVKLGQSGGLGWATWLHAAPPKRDADDLVLRPFAA
jgi:type VI secretion system protein ImpH